MYKQIHETWNGSCAESNFQLNCAAYQVNYFLLGGVIGMKGYKPQFQGNIISKYIVMFSLCLKKRVSKSAKLTIAGDVSRAFGMGAAEKQPYNLSN